MAGRDAGHRTNRKIEIRTIIIATGCSMGAMATKELSLFDSKSYEGRYYTKSLAFPSDICLSFGATGTGFIAKQKRTMSALMKTREWTGMRVCADPSLFISLLHV